MNGLTRNRSIDDAYTQRVNVKLGSPDINFDTEEFKLLTPDAKGQFITSLKELNFAVRGGLMDWYEDAMKDLFKIFTDPVSFSESGKEINWEYDPQEVVNIQYFDARSSKYQIDRIFLFLNQGIALTTTKSLRKSYKEEEAIGWDTLYINGKEYMMSESDEDFIKAFMGLLERHVVTQN